MYAIRSYYVDEIEVSRIVANPWQPRTHFDEERLEELAASINEIGVIQPITVRKNGDSYQLIAGERRFRITSYNVCYTKLLR